MPDRFFNFRENKAFFSTSITFNGVTMKQLAIKKSVSALTIAVCAGLGWQTQAVAVPQAEFNPATALLTVKAVDVGNNPVKPALVSATLKLVRTSPSIELEVVSAGAAQMSGIVAHFDTSVNKVFIPEVSVGADTFFAELELIPASNPLRFRVSKLHNTKFTSCPSFATPTSGNACTLKGTINQDITLSNDATWVLTGGVFIGDDKAKSATITIEPGTRIVGQAGADFLYIRRGSKINAVGTRQQPIIFTGAADGTDPNIGPGAWGGVLIAGNAPVNGCNATVAVCEQFDEALNTPYGGNNPTENSGIMKYAQIRYAGVEVRPDNELNALTLLGVGSGTTLDYIELYRGKDDGIEMFGGTVNFKHIVATANSDDSVDWGAGWNGKAQYVVIKQIANDGDNGIEADNNELDNNSSPRAKPVLANFTVIGSGTTVGGNAALLRRGTGANIYNSIFSGFPKSCLNIDSNATFSNAGTIAALSGQLTIDNSIVNCTKNFDDVTTEPFLVSAWFNAQTGNKAQNPGLNGHLTGALIPATGKAIPADNFIESNKFTGAFADSNDDWTAGWTFGLNR